MESGAEAQAALDALYRKVLLAVKASNSVPSEDDDFHFHAKFSKPFAAHVAASGAHVRDLIWQLAEQQDKDAATKKPKDDGDDSDDDNADGEAKRALFDGPEPNALLTDFVDTLLDDASKQLELFARGETSTTKTTTDAAPLRPLENKPQSFHKNNSVKEQEGDAPRPSVTNARGLPKPQLQFDEVIDNSDAPFGSKLREKVHALHDATATDETGAPQHPYFPEINGLKYADWQLAARKKGCYEKIAVEDASYLWVTTEETLLEMLNTLKKPEHRVVAIDLEHHSYRSYLGLVCLMQISTAKEDFLVDTLALRSKLQVLNQVFCDPARVKVLHGSDMDILWLQRDLGLYIVNMFDTGQAARLLQYPRFSLAYLLKRHCSIEADKQYQLADWRIRPLDANMIKYAREDTRYLLYIYDILKQELVAASDTSRSSLLFETLQNSSKICLQVYAKPTVSDEDGIALSDKLKSTVGIPVLTDLQQQVFLQLYHWRDRIARAEDESTAYVLPNHILIKLTKFMPTKSDQLFRTCHPVPALVRKHAHTITTMIASAKTQEAKAATTTPLQVASQKNKENVEVQSPVLSSVKQIREHAAWESGKRKAVCLIDSEAVIDLQLSAAVNQELDVIALAALQTVNDLVASATFTISENEAVDVAEKTPVERVEKRVEPAAAQDVIPQSISETYQMSNRNTAKRRKMPTTDSLNATNVKQRADDFMQQIGAKKANSEEQDGDEKSEPTISGFDYAAASERIAGAKFQLETASDDKRGGRGGRGRGRGRGGRGGGRGYNPFVRGGSDAPEPEGAKKPMKKMHHMPRSATFR